MKLGKNLDKLFDKGRKFFEDIGSCSQLTLIYDKDVDGCISAAIAIKALEKMGVCPYKVVSYDIQELGEILKSVRKSDRAIILDLGIYSIKKELKKLNKYIVVVDHHPPTALDKKIILINPRLANPNVYQPASYVCYNFFSTIVSMQEHEWLAVVGSIGDYAYEDCRDLLDKYVSVGKKEELKKTEYGRAADILNGAAAIGGFERCLDILLRAEGVRDVLKNRELVRNYQKYELALSRSEKEFWRNLQKYDDAGLWLSVIESKMFRIGSTLTTKISTEYPEKIIILLDRVGDVYRLHARYQTGRVHMGELMKKLANGGGHDRAAGGEIKVKELENFKRELIKELANFPGKRS